MTTIATKSRAAPGRNIILSPYHKKRSFTSPSTTKITKLKVETTQNAEARIMKSVHFSEACRLKYFKKYRSSEHSRLWYDEKDFIQFRRKSKMLAKLVEGYCGLVSEIESKLDESCYGLECMFKTRADLRERRRLTVLDITADCQAVGEDPELLALYCRHVSRESELEAHQRAIYQKISLDAVQYQPIMNCQLQERRMVSPVA